MKSKFRLPNGEQVDFETSADAVRYSDSNLKNALDTAKSLEQNDFGRQLLQVDSLDELRRLLEVREDNFFDEGGTLWQNIGSPAVNSNGLNVSSSNRLQSRGAITLGGNPFTVEFYAYVTDSTTPFVLGELSLEFSTIYHTYWVISGTRFCGGWNTTFNAWHHFELGYGGGTFYAFSDGTRINTMTNPYSRTFSRANRSVTLQNAVFKYLRISDGICRHTASFSPTTPNFDSYTVSLLKF